jgi:ABC-2 type transport system ATP-binding protein
MEGGWTVIEIKGLYKQIEDRCILDDVSFTVEEGQVCGLIGPNGTGKTSLMHCISGIWTPEAGEITVCGDPVKPRHGTPEALGYLMEETAFPAGWRLKDAVRFFDGIYGGYDTDRVYAMAEEMDIGPADRLDTASRGQRRRIDLILRLASGPRVLLLDEPLAGMDPDARRNAMKMMLSEVAASGMTVLVSSHVLTEVERMCDRVVMFHRGRVLADRDLEEARAQMRILQACFDEVLPEDVLQWPGVCDIRTVGRVLYLTVDGDKSEIKDLLVKSGALFVEELGMDLDEMFLQWQRGEEE